MTTETAVQAASSVPAEGEAVSAEETIVSTAAGTAPEDEQRPEGAEGKPSEDDNEQEDDGRPRKRSRTDRYRDRIRELSVELEAERRRNSGAGTKEAPKAPAEADFNGDYAAFEAARHEFSVEQAIRRVRDEDARTANEAKSRELNDARASLYRERAAEAKSTLTDFDKVLESSRNEQVRDDISDFIQESEKGPHLAYHLAKHPEQLRDLNRLPPMQAARELARIEARLSVATPKKQTSAPAPISSLRGGAAPTRALSEMSMDEYVAARRKEG